MRDIQFEWDPGKERRNRQRHGVSFAEGETVFSDEHAVLIGDPDHAEAEDRFLLLGLSARLRILVVVHCYRAENAVVRIISARKATRKERDMYNQRWQR